MVGVCVCVNRTAIFSLTNSCISSIQCIYASRVIFTINNYYFPLHHLATCLSNGNSVFWGVRSEYIYIYIYIVNVHYVLINIYIYIYMYVVYINCSVQRTWLKCLHNAALQAPTSVRTLHCFSAYFQNPICITLPALLINICPCFQPTLARRTRGHCLGTFGAGNISVFLAPLLSLFFLFFFRFS